MNEVIISVSFVNIFAFFNVVRCATGIASLWKNQQTHWSLSNKMFFNVITHSGSSSSSTLIIIVSLNNWLYHLFIIGQKTPFWRTFKFSMINTLCMSRLWIVQMPTIFFGIFFVGLQIFRWLIGRPCPSIGKFNKQQTRFSSAFI